MSKCKICGKDIRNYKDLFVIANSLFAKPNAYHSKCYLSKDNENKVKKKHRLINSEALKISMVIQVVIVLFFAFILFGSEPDSLATMIAFPMALLIVVIAAEFIQTLYSYLRFEKVLKK